MTIVEIIERSERMTQRQRWSHYFVLIYAVAALFIALNLRDTTITATVPYVDREAGIRAYYPQSWLLDNNGDYVFRVRDMSQTGYKTTIQVDVQPVTINTSARNLLDSLNLNRAQSLSAYDVLSNDPFLLPNDQAATAMTYVFVASETNPFLESLPTIVEGLDVIVIQGGQAIIITFLSDVETYEQNYPVFQRFLNDLEF